jgi:histidine triad (HIT) family protein
MASDCLFCRIVAGEIPSDQVYSDDQVIAFRDIAPKAPVHVLVIPRRHLDSTADLGEADAPLAAALLAASNEVARREGVAESGYRVVTNVGADAGQSVAHLHLHVLGGRRMAWPPG